MDSSELFLRVRERITARPREVLTVAKLAEVVGSNELVRKVRDIEVTRVNEESNGIIVISALNVVEAIMSEAKCEVVPIGASAIVVSITEPAKRASSFITLAKVLFVCLLLFVGSALAIMNFHADVSMAETQRTIYKIFTGEEEERPLTLQIPYSIGIGVGMILFFNHVFKKPLSNEPSPLELEMYQYEQTLNQYIQDKIERQEKDRESEL